MTDGRKYKVWGYPEKSDPQWNHKGRFIGSTEGIEEARKLKESATTIGWGTVLILDGDLVVE
ncbi:MAG: hypothetical protein ABSD67_24050 [Terracidiphilus sp.]|jgi:hypothetical protein